MLAAHPTTAAGAIGGPHSGGIERPRVALAGSRTTLAGRGWASMGVVSTSSRLHALRKREGGVSARRIGSLTAIYLSGPISVTYASPTSPAHALHEVVDGDTERITRMRLERFQDTCKVTYMLAAVSAVAATCKLEDF